MRYLSLYCKLGLTSGNEHNHLFNIRKLGQYLIIFTIKTMEKPTIYRSLLILIKDI